MQMKKYPFILLFFVLSLNANAQSLPSFTYTLKNGLQIIVCEKKGGNFAEVQVWYKTGSKDETPGIRGMAHMFEHMMFRGSEKYKGDFLQTINRRLGWQSNAYTSFDQTVYHESVPLSSIDTAFDIEADRMENLILTQEILNTERQVVGEEYRNGKNNWFQKLQEDIYPHLYPKGHPYEVNVIGNLDEITSFTREQCRDFYANYYSPNNAFVVVVGNVKADEIFKKAEQYFGHIRKQVSVTEKKNVPDIFNSKIRIEELPIELPMQIYCLAVPSPAVSSSDYIAFKMLTEILFTDPNSVLTERLVKKEHLAYGIQLGSNFWSLHPSFTIIHFVMDYKMGNVKVKKAIREEISNVIENGIDSALISSYIKYNEANSLFSRYSNNDIAMQLGMAHYYYKDCRKAFSIVDKYKKVSIEDLKKAAATYYNVDKLQFVNIKPE